MKENNLPRPVSVRSPSNIAFIKYWGKRDPSSQWPANDSLSMTLSQASTITTARQTRLPNHEVYFSGQQLFETENFAKKVFAHLRFLAKEFGFQAKLRIETTNTFPASCGIASSASGFSALTMSALAAWTESKNFGDLASRGFAHEKLAYLCRLGSGSACRSVLGGFVQWVAGENPSLQHVKTLHPADHWPLSDLIVVVSSKKKSTSSSLGHQSAASSPFFAPRIAALPERLALVKDAIAAKNLDALGPWLEVEALEMHALMATSKPAATYLTSDSLHVITWLREARRSEGLPAYFTIDAGPNIHVICETSDSQRVAARISDRFPQFEILHDKIGNGPSFEEIIPTRSEQT